MIQTAYSTQKQNNVDKATPRAESLLKRKCACGKPITANGECAECHKKQLTLQRKAVNPSTSSTSEYAPPIVHEVLREPGRPLDSATRQIIEPRFGHDFSQVRVHTGYRASESAQAVNSLAYTVGSHIVFGTRQYRPHTPDGHRLITHEVTHTIQQRSNASILPGQIEIGATNDQYEQRAEKLATSIDSSAVSDPIGTLSTPLLQRQAPVGVHLSSQNIGPHSVPSEKWRQDVELAYRRAGLNEEADAVRRCREEIACNKLLTLREAFNMYRSGRSAVNLAPPERSELSLAHGAPLAVAAQSIAAAQQASAAAAAESAVARTAATRVTFTFLKGGAEVVAVAEAGVGTTAAAGTAATVANVAPPVAAVIVVILATIDIISWSRFESALENQGFIILPDPLGVCIGSCHQSSVPSSPTFRPFPNTSRSSPSFPSSDQPSPDEFEQIARWIREQAPPQDSTQNAPNTSTQPVPQSQPIPARRRRRRRRNVNIILRLPPQKTVHLSRYAALVREGRLIHDINYSRGRPAQARNWDKKMRPPTGDMSWQVWDHGSNLGLIERQILRPTWSRDRLGAGMGVDHIVELQVTPNNERNIWNEAQNYELLDSSSNSSSGTKLDQNIAAERRRLVALTGDPSYLIRRLVFTQVQPTSGPAGERWLSDEIRTGEHLNSYEELTGTRQ